MSTPRWKPVSWKRSDGATESEIDAASPETVMVGADFRWTCDAGPGEPAVLSMKAGPGTSGRYGR